MKKLIQVLAVLVLVISSFAVGMSQAQASGLQFTMSSSPILAVTERRNPADQLLETEFGKKYDLNNTPLRKFRELPGFYPTLAKKIGQYAPYEKVEDVLNIPDLSEGQKAKLEANLDKFTVTPPIDVFNEEDNRINPGVY